VQLAQVELEVEVRVVEPVRVVEAERHLNEPPAQRGQQVKPLAKHAGDVSERDRSVRCGSRIEDRDGGHVAMGAAILGG
jgi:hypothetical protein